MGKIGPAGLMVVNVTTSPLPFLAADPNRRKLVFSSPRAARVTIGEGGGLADERGIVLRPGTAPVAVCCCDYGNWPQKELWIVGSAAEPIGVVVVNKAPDED